jgi:hypothetical protein
MPAFSGCSSAARLRLCLVETLEFGQDLSEIGQRPCIVRLQGQHPAVGRLGVDQAAPAGEGGGVIEMRFGQTGHELDGSRRAFRRFLVQSLLVER